MNTVEMWKVLGIEPTKDENEIINAYRAKVVTVNPEDDAEGFMALREAFEMALNFAKEDDVLDDGQHEKPRKQASCQHLDLSGRVSRSDRGPGLSAPHLRASRYRAAGMERRTVRARRIFLPCGAAFPASRTLVPWLRVRFDVLRRARILRQRLRAHAVPDAGAHGHAGPARHDILARVP